MTEQTDKYKLWLGVYLDAYIWHCGDEVCNCYQPKIDRISPNLDVGYPWAHREELWEGTFHSDPDREEQEEQARELREECARRGITLTDEDSLYPFGRRSLHA